jgi:hypothetical protein
MTFILTVNGKETAWLLADRRLSAHGHTPKEDAKKILRLDATDGSVQIGYCGLGSTSLGTEPAEWMNGVLRGRQASVESYLHLLAIAFTNELPKHLLRISTGKIFCHTALINGFIKNKPVLYTIDFVIEPDGKTYFTRLQNCAWHSEEKGVSFISPIGVAGSGSVAFMKNFSRMRDLKKLAMAYEARKVSVKGMLDHLALINYEIHKETTDGTVGPRCIIVWKNRENGAFSSGGGIACYSGTDQDRDCRAVPTISNGIDVRALTNVTFKHVLSDFIGERAGVINTDEINADLAALPIGPDEKLR